MQAIYPGTSPETPKTVEMWAVWVWTRRRLRAHSRQRLGSADLPSATLCDLSDDDMRSLGLTGRGKSLVSLHLLAEGALARSSAASLSTYQSGSRTSRLFPAEAQQPASRWLHLAVADSRK